MIAEPEPVVAEPLEIPEPVVAPPPPKPRGTKPKAAKARTRVVSAPLPIVAPPPVAPAVSALPVIEREVSADPDIDWHWYERDPRDEWAVPEQPAPVADTTEGIWQRGRTWGQRTAVTPSR